MTRLSHWLIAPVFLLGLSQAKPTVPRRCAKLKVPLDYTDPDNQKEVALDLTKIEALTKPSKGSILINFGGPGEPARGSFASNQLALMLLGLTGGEYDLIGFDPRFGERTVRNRPGQNRRWLVSSRKRPELGRLKHNKTGQFLGTSFIARDMMQIVDALDEDGMLRYWGMSYGTYIGAVAANMFPNKIDKMMLGAVVNPFDWRLDHDFESLIDTDATFSRFYLEKKLYKFFDGLRLEPMVFQGVILDYKSVKASLYANLKYPENWQLMSKILDVMMKRDSKMLEALGGDGGGGGSSTTKESQWGIRCNDMTGQTDDIHDVIPILNKRWDTSRFAADVIEDVVMRCSRWKLPAKERYEGDFKAKTKNPVLVIGQTSDPITPMASARNLAGTLEGSVLLEFNIPGHSILRRSSECVIKATAAYWSEGKLSKNNTVCKSDVEPFSTETGWVEMIKELGMGPKE
ncbi:hypothetical protein NCS52_01239300 [Fusarium sp. LHS14.1]|nr:hypothetical protein NCS52_01239300 [Fusarium sp. LHS14.1]